MNTPNLKKFKGHWVRADRKDDRNMINECHDVYKYFTFREGDVVLDLGVNVGGFACMALQHPIARYVGVEADPENLFIARKNIKDGPRSMDLSTGKPTADVILLGGAASAYTCKTLTFAQTESGNAKCSGSIVINKRNEHHRTIRYKVKNFNLDELFRQYGPTLVKMDIEGAEYGWFEANGGVFPSFVREIAFDLHTEAGIHRFEKEWLPTVLKDFEIVNVQANTAFEAKKQLKWSFPGFGIKGYGRVYALDVFFRRRNR